MTSGDASLRPTNAQRAYRIAAENRQVVREMAGGRVQPFPISGRRAVVILSASRSYSSLLFALLRSTDLYVSLQGEHSHLYKMSGISAPLTVDADDALIHTSDKTCRRFRSELEWELAVDAMDGRFPRDVALRVAYRLYAQWDDLPPPADLVPAIAGVIRSIEFQALDTPEGRFLEIVRSLRYQGIAIDPWYYDIPPSAVTAFFPALPVPHGPPTPSAAVEESPFVVPRTEAGPGQGRPRSDDAPLLLKASVDAHRVALLARLFGPDTTVVHLTRNPGASISGLMDGWLSHKFYSQPLPEGYLNITDYSMTESGRDGWWKFDAPPGWQGVRSSKLADVCAYQWTEAHRSIATSRCLAPLLRVKGEELVVGDRQRLLDAALKESGLPTRRVEASVNPVSMATHPPEPRRWWRRTSQLTEVLASDAVRSTAASLGYGEAHDSAWI